MLMPTIQSADLWKRVEDMKTMERDVENKRSARAKCYMDQLMGNYY